MAFVADDADDSHAGLSGLTPEQRDQALARWQVLRAHLDDGCPTARVAPEHGVPERTLRRWLAAYRTGGLAALARRPRSDRGTRRMPPELQLLIEGLALRRPPPAIATVHRQAAEVARQQGWPVPGYAAVYDVVRSIDPAMATLAHEGSKRYKEVFDLVYRREAAKPNQIWQADHTLLDLWVVTPSGRPGRPWLTLIEDDHSRAVAGYAVNLDAPSALTTALAFRQAIWRKPWPGWHVCGIPDAFHVDHGPDFTSAHLEQVMADLRTRAYFSLPGQPRGRGKVERIFVAKPRKIHPDGIHFQGLRYLDPVLAAYVGDTVIIRYDPRDMAEIRVFTGAGFLCRAICPELAGTTVSLKDITAARNARRRGLARGLRERASVVDGLLAAHQDQPPPGMPGTPVITSPLKLYRTE